MSKGNLLRSPKVIVIVGPTASGKSDLAIWLARKIDGEIISADSRQVYRSMDIGTGKVTPEEQQLVPHHLLDVADPKQTFTVAQYKKLAQKTIQQILKRSRTPIICGGTGFYIDSLIYDLEFPEVKPNSKLRKELSKKSTTELFKILKKLDPTRARTIEKQNPVRLIRAIEIATAIGKSPKINTSYHQLKSKYDVLWLGITWPKEKLEKRIKKRLNKRLDQGMLDEIKGLLHQGISAKKLKSFGLEYRWITEYIEGRHTTPQLKEGLSRDIIHYSKRQMTWFKRNPRIHWNLPKPQIKKLINEFLLE